MVRDSCEETKSIHLDMDGNDKNLSKILYLHTILKLQTSLTSTISIARNRKHRVGRRKMGEKVPGKSI